MSLLFGASIDNAPMRFVFFINFFKSSSAYFCGSVVREDCRDSPSANALDFPLIRVISKLNSDYVPTMLLVLETKILGFLDISVDRDLCV